MKHRMISLMLGAIATASLGSAQTKGYERWVGVWQGQLDGQPGVTVTLGRDAGELAGTIVFKVVSRDGAEARVIGHDAHSLTHVRLDDNSLEFNVIRLGDERELHLAMRMTDDGRAQLQCADCGGPSQVDLLRVK